MLPGEPDSAVYLRVQVRVLVGGGQGQRRGHGRGVGELVASRGGGPGRVPHGSRRQLGGDQHVGAVVLDGLEHADRPAELLAHLRILAGHRGALAGHAGRLGGEEHAGEVQHDLAAAGEDFGLRAVERHPGGAAGRIEVGGNLGRHAAAPAVDDGDVVAHRDEQNVGEVTAEDHPGRAGGLAAGDDHVTAERHRASQRAVGQAGQQAGLSLRRADRGEHGAGRHRGDERAGSDRAAQFLGHDDELGQAEAGAAVLLGQVQPEPAKLGQLGPVCRQPLAVGIQQGPGSAAGTALGQEIRDGLGEGAVFIGDGDRHVCTIRENTGRRRG